MGFVLGGFYQRVSIASYAKRWYSQRRNVRLSVRLSVTLRYCITTKKASVMISSPSESQNILVSRNIWFITKFDRGYPERGRFLRLGLVRTGDFGNFSTNKPPYLRTLAQPRVGTGGHVRTLPRPGWVVRFAQIRGVFWSSRGGGGCRLRMNPKVHRIFMPTMNTSYVIVSIQSPVLSLLNRAYSDRVSSASVQGESKNQPPEVFWHFF